MEVWAWILAYIVGFSLLQLLVYRYFQRGEASVEGPSTRTGDRYSGRIEGLDDESDHPDANDSVVCCRNCGTHNERVSTYRYCKQCVTPL